MSANYINGLSNLSLDRYQKKLTLCGIKCPYTIPAGGWMNDPTAWPPLDFPKLFLYLIKTPGGNKPPPLSDIDVKVEDIVGTRNAMIISGVHTMEAMANYKGLDSYRLLQSGWIQTVYHHCPDESHAVIFKADVTPSYKVNDKPHHPWLALDRQGTVMTAHCDCKAGLGESCSHVGGLLHKIETIVRVGGSHKACTDELCQWNHSEWKGVKPATLQEIQLYNQSAKDKLTTANARKRRGSPTPMTNEEKDTFLRRMLQHNSKLPVGLSLFQSTAMHFVSKIPIPEKVTLPTSPRNLYQLTLTPDEALHFLSTTDTQRQYLEELTRAQSSTLTWHQQRAGRLTASRIRDILRTNQDSPAPSLLKSICSDSPSSFSTPALTWGREHETIARQEYAEWLLHEHPDATVMESGLRIHPEKPHFAASPDGLVWCSCCGYGLVEIKCPYTFKCQTIAEMKNSVNCSLHADGTLKSDHKFHFQVQHQLFVTERKFCDFVVWLQPGHMAVTRVPCDPLYNETIIPKLDSFWRQHVHHELCTHELQLVHKSKESTKTSHCSCGQPDDVEHMIGCDSVDCTHEWYHWSCVGIEVKPRAKQWYCPACKRSQNKCRRK